MILSLGQAIQAHKRQRDLDDQQSTILQDQLSEKKGQDQNNRENIQQPKQPQEFHNNKHDKPAKELQQSKKYKKFSKKIIKFVDLLRSYYFIDDYNQNIGQGLQNLDKVKVRHRIKKITKILNEDNQTQQKNQLQSLDKQENLNIVNNQNNCYPDEKGENNYQNNKLAQEDDLNNCYSQDKGDNNLKNKKKLVQEDHDVDENDCQIVDTKKSFQQKWELTKRKNQEHKGIKSNNDPQLEQIYYKNNMQEAKDNEGGQEEYEEQQDNQEIFEKAIVDENKSKRFMQDIHYQIFKKPKEIQQNCRQKQKSVEVINKNKIFEKKIPYTDIDLSSIDDLDQFDFQDIVESKINNDNLKQIHIIPATKNLQNLRKFYFNRFHLQLNQFVVLYYKCRDSKTEINIILINSSTSLSISKDLVKSRFGNAYIYGKPAKKKEFQFLIKKCDVLENRQTMFFPDNEYQLDNIRSTAFKNQLIGNGLLIKYININNFQQLLDDLQDIYLIKNLIVQKKSTSTIICYMKHTKVFYVYHYQKREFNCVCRDVFYHENLESIQTLDEFCTMPNALRLMNEEAAGNQIKWYPQNITIPEDYEFNNLRSSFVKYQKQIYKYESQQGQSQKIQLQQSIINQDQSGGKTYYMTSYNEMPAQARQKLDQQYSDQQRQQKYRNQDN